MNLSPMGSSNNNAQTSTPHFAVIRDVHSIGGDVFSEIIHLYRNDLFSPENIYMENAKNYF